MDFLQDRQVTGEIVCCSSWRWVPLKNPVYKQHWYCYSIIKSQSSPVNMEMLKLPIYLCLQKQSLVDGVAIRAMAQLSLYS